MWCGASDVRLLVDARELDSTFCLAPVAVNGRSRGILPIDGIAVRGKGDGRRRTSCCRCRTRTLRAVSPFERRPTLTLCCDSGIERDDKPQHLFETCCIVSQQILGSEPGQFEAHKQLPSESEELLYRIGRSRQCRCQLARIERFEKSIVRSVSIEQSE